MCETLKEIALMECRITDLMKMDDEQYKKCQDSLIQILVRKNDPIGKEIIELEGHKCALKSYRIAENSQIRRGISKGELCWCSCDNYEEKKECICNCRMLMGVIIERAEKNEHCKIMARLLDDLKIEDVMQIPYLTKNICDKNVTIKQALKGINTPQLNFVDRYIWY